PRSFAQWDNASIARYIGGFIAADGWVSNGVIGFGNNSYELLRTLKDTLEQRFGIYCTRITGKNKKKPDGGLYDTNYTFCISGEEDIRYFYSVVFIPGIKQQYLADAVSQFRQPIYERGRYTVIEQIEVGMRDTWD